MKSRHTGVWLLDLKMHSGSRYRQPLTPTADVEPSPLYITSYAAKITVDHEHPCVCDCGYGDNDSCGCLRNGHVFARPTHITDSTVQLTIGQ
jgi:hypothetical protein